MPTRERRVDRARRIARRALIGVGEELRQARVGAGVSQREVGRTVGLSHTHIGRIERGLVPSVPFATLASIAGVLGLDLPLRAYPNGDPIRDAAQIALLGRLRATLPDQIRWQYEVPLGIPGDLRAWDAVITGHGWSLPVEAETRLADGQSLLRRLRLKQQDGEEPRILLLLAATRRNREGLRVAAEAFSAAFSVSPRSAIAALRRGEPPPGSAIVLA
jgi:transcriptional regulator with XRE-family HTH domain